ncbi:MAG: hypothetical protein KJ077_10770 [Anaerolineae bacterium]|nr:hypothetical protein [Anaerolineae bacterium]
MLMVFTRLVSEAYLPADDSRWANVPGTLPSEVVKPPVYEPVAVNLDHVSMVEPIDVKTGIIASREKPRRIDTEDWQLREMTRLTLNHGAIIVALTYSQFCQAAHVVEPAPVTPVEVR